MRAPATRRAHRGAHLTRRFVGSLRPRAITPAEHAWVASVLTSAERAVWNDCARVDQVEAIAVARRLPHAIAVDDRWIAAALLHDVGKQCAHLGTIGRVLATMLAALGRIRGPEEARSDTDRPGLRSRMARYVAHPEIGAEVLAGVGARPEAVAWAAAHHDPSRWSGTEIPPEVCQALARADGETAPAHPG